MLKTLERLFSENSFRAADLQRADCAVSRPQFVLEAEGHRPLSCLPRLIGPCCERTRSRLLFLSSFPSFPSSLPPLRVRSSPSFPFAPPLPGGVTSKSAQNERRDDTSRAFVPKRPPPRGGRSVRRAAADCVYVCVYVRLPCVPVFLQGCAYLCVGVGWVGAPRVVFKSNS